MQVKQINKFILGLISGVLFTLSVGSFASSEEVKTIQVNNKESFIPTEDINNFAKAYAITKNYYVENVSDSKMMDGAINGMLSNLDPHSNYLNKEELKHLTEMTAGSFAGVGIEISKDKDKGIKVVAPIDETPAYYAGIKSGDIIVKIDGQVVSSMTLEEAVKKMRGKPDTFVKLTILRSNELKPLSFAIKRAKIKIKSIKYNMLSKEYAYLRITNFQSDTIPSMVLVLNTILSQNPNLKGLVIDLRDNPGGLLQGAVGVAGAFLPTNSLIVYTNGRAPNSSQKFYNTASYYDSIEEYGKVTQDSLSKLPSIFKTLPLVVMVNQGSASASEIVAGALQDYKRAKIIGVKTFGKGSVQTVIPLSADTAIKLTTALYYTPKGRSIQAQGIKPDIIVRSEYEDILNGWDVSEADFENHINNPNNKDGVVGNDNTPIITPPKQITTKNELELRTKKQINSMPKVVNQNIASISLKDDFQLQWALNILQGKSLGTLQKTPSHK